MSSFSYPNGEPQTPTRTPTAAAFGDSPFQTPRIESSFYDPRVTWDTADPYASSPELLKTPQRLSFGSPSHHLQSADALRGRDGQDTDPARRRRPSKQNAGGGDEGPASVDSAKNSAASIQTPPPTSTGRRKGTANPNVQTPLASAARLSAATLTTQLETPSRLFRTPGMSEQSQSSPDIFQLSSADPTASPFFPQQRLFWEPDTAPPSDMSLASVSNDVFGSDDTPFTMQSTAQTLGVPHLSAMQDPLDLPPTFGSGAVRVGMSSASSANAAQLPAPFSTSPRVPMTKAEDPNMFLSSPARRFGPQPSPEQQRVVRRQPYHHQTEESKREQLDREVGGLYYEDDDDDDDDDENLDFPPIALGQRPGLTRSQTHTAVTSHARQSGQPSLLGPLASTSGIKKPPLTRGRTSPIKSMRQPLARTNSASLPSRSQSLVLKIDKDGRAKTELQQPSTLTEPVAPRDVSDPATESEADYSDYTISANSSFAYSGATLSRSQGNRAAAALSRPSSKSSYSTVGSATSGRRSPWTDFNRARPQDAPQTPRRPSMQIQSSADWTRSSSATENTRAGENEESGDAQHALRKVLEGRGRSARHGTYNRHLQSSPPVVTGRLDTSPTTITDPDVVTPSTDRHSNPSNGTRCVCKSMDNGGHLMIQW